MRKRVNIQKDVVSRDRISNALPRQSEVIEVKETEVEILVVTDHAESEIVPEPTNDESSEPTKKPKKGRRSSEGNV